MNSPRRRVVEDTGRKPPELQGIRVVFALYDERPYRRGQCRYMSAHAEADVAIEGIVQVLTSGAVFGIASDAEDSVLERIAEQEWTVLRRVLTAVGVSTAELPIDIDPEWVEWRT